LKFFLKIAKDNDAPLWKIMKRIYSEGRMKEYMRIKQKLEKFERYGLIISEGKPKRYSLIEDNVKLKPIEYNGKSVESICIFTSGAWCSFQI
jgi:hypothetical protein